MNVKQCLPEPVEINGVLIDPVGIDDAVSFVQSAIKHQRKVHIVTPNPEMIVLAQSNAQFKQTLNDSSLHIPDGVGVQVAGEYFAHKGTVNVPVLREAMAVMFWFYLLFRGLLASRSFKTIPFRTTGVDLCNQIVHLPGVKLFLLGGSVGVAEEAAQLLNEKYPNLPPVGFHQGGDINSDGRGPLDEEIVVTINSYKPDVILVCFGAPQQDLWLSKNLSLLNTHVGIGVGGTLDFIVNRQQRAPRWIRRISLEWLWRFIKQPSRIHRIWTAVYVFSCLCIRKKITMVQSGYGTRG
ncbi:WecB/TagA/CpsF family glycosyltransferase [candidate division WWE3 bacterium]|nr:WecB/TagA/CpsF family glycosyltransferase [candidate division WWE3 bacterium]